jgi:hypothetical protein
MVYPKNILVLLALCLVGCSSTIHMQNGPKLEGTIVRSDAGYVYVETKTAPSGDSSFAAQTIGEGKEGPIVRVERKAIKEVDHEGFAAGVTGSVLSGLGVILLGTSVASIAAKGCSGDFGCAYAHGFFTLPGALLLGAGLPTMIPGWIMYTKSQKAMAFEAQGAQQGFRIQLRPRASTSNGQSVVGLSAQGAW